MDTIISHDAIKRSAVDAADAGQSADEACPWPQGSVAANKFKDAHDERVKQLKTMEEVV